MAKCDHSNLVTKEDLGTILRYQQWMNTLYKKEEVSEVTVEHQKYIRCNWCLNMSLAPHYNVGYITFGGENKPIQHSPTCLVGARKNIKWY